MPDTLTMDDIQSFEPVGGEFQMDQVTSFAPIQEEFEARHRNSTDHLVEKHRRERYPHEFSEKPSFIKTLSPEVLRGVMKRASVRRRADAMDPEAAGYLAAEREVFGVVPRIEWLTPGPDETPEAFNKRRRREMDIDMVRAKFALQEASLREQVQFRDKVINAVGSTGRGFGSVLASLPKSMAVFFSGVDELLGREERPVEQNLFYEIGQEIEDAVTGMMPLSDPRQRGSFLTEELPAAAGGMAGFLGAGAAGRAAKLGGALTTALVGAGANATEVYEEARAQGLNQEESLQKAGLGGLIGLSETIPISRAFGRIGRGGWKNAIKSALVGMGEEGVQEFSQQIGNNFILGEPLLKGVKSAAGTGGILGFLMNLGMAVLPGKLRAANTFDRAETVPIGGYWTKEKLLNNTDEYVLNHPDHAEAIAREEKPSRSLLAKATGIPRSKLQDFKEQDYRNIAQKMRESIARTRLMSLLRDSEGSLGAPSSDQKVKEILDEPLEAMDWETLKERAKAEGVKVRGTRAQVAESIRDAQLDRLPIGVIGAVSKPDWGGIVVDKVDENVRAGLRVTADMWKRFMTSPGDMPQPMFDAKIRKEGSVEAELKQMAFTLRDFRKAVNKVYGNPVFRALRGGLNKKQIRDIDNVLKGGDPNTIPEQLRPVVRRMRDHIDSLSRKLIDLGFLDGPLEGAMSSGATLEPGTKVRARDRDNIGRIVSVTGPNMARVHFHNTKTGAKATVELPISDLQTASMGPSTASSSTLQQNIGVYARRAFKAHHVPKWAEKIDPKIRNISVAALRAEFPGMSQEEIDGKINAWLYAAEESGSPMAWLKRAKLGSKDLSILRKRKDLPQWFLDLFGEVKDARFNYANSVASMAQLVANHKMLSEIRDAGMGKFLFEKPQSGPDGNFVVPIAADVSEVMYPLNGLHTTPEIASAMQQSFDPSQLSTFWRNYMRVNGVVKFSKTVGSLMTHIRNVLGNTGFAVANGHWRVWKSNQAIKDTWASLLSGGTEETRARVKRAAELGVISESARGGEILDFIKDSLSKPLDDYLAGWASRQARRAMKGVVKIYQAEDDLWKLYAWENEKARYRKAKPTWTDQQVEERAAQIVRNTYPTYSMVSEAIKKLRRFPVIGTFVSFPSEVVRTGYHTIKLAHDEIADPDTRAIGVQRAIGVLAAATGPFAAATWAMYQFGLTADDDRDIREFVAPWSENSRLFHLGETGPGKYRYIDLSYTDPYQYLKKPAIALLRGENWEDGIVTAFVEAGKPFFSEEILAQKLLDISRNRKVSGGKVFNEQDTGWQKMTDIAEHVWTALEPGVVTSARRVWNGIRGHTNRYGRSYDPAIESLAVVTGHRIEDLDVAQAFMFKAGEYNRSLQETKQIYTRTLTNRGVVSESEIVSAYQRMDNRARELHVDMVKKIQAARNLGLTTADIIRSLKVGGVGETQTRSLVNDVYRPYVPSSEVLQKAGSADRDRLRIITELARQAQRKAG